MNAPRPDVGTVEGLIAHFEARAERRTQKLRRRTAAGNAHKLHSLYAVFAREDIGKVKALLRSLQSGAKR